MIYNIWYFVLVPSYEICRFSSEIVPDHLGPLFMGRLGQGRLLQGDFQKKLYQTHVHILLKLLLHVLSVYLLH